jgi:hypothetical protein
MNFLKKIFSPTILTISFLLLIYTCYKSEIVWNGDNRNYYKTYYLISSILICFSIITFFIKDIIKEYLIISGITLIVSLYLFEGYLTFEIDLLKDRILKEKLYEKQTGNKWDKRSNLEVYKELKKKNNNITNFYIPIKFDDKSYSPYPLSGISNSETIHCNENGYYSIYQSDRYGFNNPDEEWDKKEIEYLLVGDSFTHGACVNRPNDIGSVLRNLSKKSVLNLGMSGNGPLIQYATLREYLDKNVKKIIWIYYEINDLDNLEFEIKKKNNILNKYLKDLNFTQNLKNKQNDIDSLLSNLINKEKVKAESKTFKFKFLNFIKIYNTRTFILQKSTLIPTPAHATALEFKRILQLAKELANKNNTKIYFLYLPGDMRYKKTYDDINYNLVKKIVTELKIPFIDIHIEIFKKEQNPLRLFSFGHFAHYNVDGYKKVAETIYKFTKD